MTTVLVLVFNLVWASTDRQMEVLKQAEDLSCTVHSSQPNRTKYARLQKLHKPRNNKNNEHILVFGKTTVGGNADTGSLTTTRLRNCLSVPCSSLWMWSVHRSAALLHTWPDCLIHSGLCAAACWCWKPQTPGLRVDTFYLPQAGKLHISFPKKKINGAQGSVTAVADRLRKKSFWSEQGKNLMCAE